MKKGKHAYRPGRRRVKYVTFRCDLEDYELLGQRAAQAGTKNRSEYLRRQALTGAVIAVEPRFEVLRDIRNEIINLRAELRVAPDTKEYKITLAKMHKALDKIPKLK
jgi:hypothetical protein